MFFDVVIRCYAVSRCIICYSLHYILHERDEFLNSFSAAAYRISVGLVMSATGDGVALRWFDVPGVLLPRVGDRRFFWMVQQLALC